MGSAVKVVVPPRKVKKQTVRAYYSTGILPVVENHGQDGDPKRDSLRLGTHATGTPHGVATDAGLGLTPRGSGHRIPPSFFGWANAGQFGERVLRWPLIAIR